LHLLRDLDPEKVEALFQDARSQFREGKARCPRGLIRFQDRAALVEAMKGVGQFEEIIRQKVRAKIVQDLRDNFGELRRFFGERNLGGLRKEDLHLWHGLPAHVSIGRMPMPYSLGRGSQEKT